MNWSYLQIIAIILAYLIGSIATSVWIGKFFFNVDVRDKGSGNAGATNTLRVIGVKAGIIVLLIDVLKGFVVIKMADFFIDENVSDIQLLAFQIILAIAVVIGHVFPLYTAFNGGKGIATLFGVGIALCPETVMFSFLVFLVIFVLFKYVSLASILAAVSFPFINYFFFNAHLLPLILFTLAVAIFVPLTHRKNINRLIQGKELKVHFSKNIQNNE